MMDEEIRQALNEVREMKQMCGNINMKLTNIVTQRGQDYKKKLEAEYQRGFEDGKWKSEDGCTGCEWEGTPFDTCETCCNNYKNQWTAKKQDDEIKVGDEVITPDGTHFVVFEVGGYFGDDAVGTFILFGENNSSVDIKAGCFSHSMTLIAKTGRHFDIDKILAEMRT